MPITVLMPALSPTLEKANLTKWVKKEGDKIKLGDIIAEIETDKVEIDLEASDEGTLGKILVPEGTADVAVNTPIALIFTEGEGRRLRQPESARNSSIEIFIVHGHDSAAKAEVARLIEHAGLAPTILHERANRGRTIFEKFETHGGAAGFAIILLTPDDVGGPTSDNLKPRARQNVVGEMFWFAGKLGRARICALKKGDIELPSDLVGLAYTEMDERGYWKVELLRELEAAGCAVDWKRALSA